MGGIDIHPEPRGFGGGGDETPHVSLSGAVKPGVPLGALISPPKALPLPVTVEGGGL